MAELNAMNSFILSEGRKPPAGARISNGPLGHEILVYQMLPKSHEYFTHMASKPCPYYSHLNVGKT